LKTETSQHILFYSDNCCSLDIVVEVFFQIQKLLTSAQFWASRVAHRIVSTNASCYVSHLCVSIPLLLHFMTIYLSTFSALGGSHIMYVPNFWCFKIKQYQVRSTIFTTYQRSASETSVSLICITAWCTLVLVVWSTLLRSFFWARLCLAALFCLVLYKVVQIWPGRFVCKQVTVCPGHIWTTLYSTDAGILQLEAIHCMVSF
jgi:hypothetical protein